MERFTYFEKYVKEAEAAERRWKYFKRTLLLAVPLALGGVIEHTRGDLWRVADLGLGELAQMEKNIENERAEVSKEYIETAAIPESFDEVTKLFLETEYATYLRRNYEEPETNIDEFVTEVYRPFMDAVSSQYQPGENTVDSIVNVKQALENQILTIQKEEDLYYWAPKNVIVDVLKTGDLQCRSGSRMLLLATMENVQLQEGERLLKIATDTHVQMGLLTSEGKVIAFEMTKRGKGIRDFGQLDEIKEPVIVVDAKHDLMQSAIDLRVHEDKAVLLDTVPEGFQVRAGNGAQNNELSSLKTTDKYAFSSGTVKIPEGRIPMTKMDYIPSTSRGSNLVYDTMKALPSGEWFQTLTQEEQATIIDFEQYMPVVEQLYSPMKRNIRIMQETQDSEELRQAALEVLSKAVELEEFAKENKLSEKHAAYIEVILSYIKKSGQDIIMRANPEEISQESTSIVVNTYYQRTGIDLTKVAK